MKVSRLLIGGLLMAFAMGVSAQWQWIDQNGRKVFSDSAPPPEIPQKNILKQPGPRASAAAAAAAASAPAAAASAPKLSGKEAELEARKKAADQAAAEKKKAQEQEMAKARADNCERARRHLQTLESGMRVAQTNAKGEREYMGDEQRAAEIKRARDITSKDCLGPQ